VRAPRKAFILAAGLGTRLRPLTLTTPKPMLPLWDRPMLARTLAMLADWGVQQVLINLHHAPGPILNYLASQPFPQLRITAVFEPTILGTGGALRNARWFLDEPCWLLNADIVAHVSPRPLLRVWHKERPLAACWLTDAAGPKTVRCADGWIQDFHRPQDGQATFCGLQLLDQRILPFIAPEGFDTIIAAYQRAQQQGHRIAGVCVPGSFWADIGTPAQYVQAHRDTAGLFGRAGEPFNLPAAATFSSPEQKCLRITVDHPVTVLPPRGSNREFFKVPDLPGISGPALVIRWSPERPENKLYAGHTVFLQKLGIPVPRLLLNAPRARLLAMEFIGPDTLESRLPRLTPTQALRLYRQVLTITLRLHTRGLAVARRIRRPLMPGFTPQLYAWEHDYFIQHVMRELLRASASRCAKVADELRTVANLLAASPQALIHRDWQSSNILLRGNGPVMIDYQGMRRGPIAYDLASLLCDPYANLPAAWQQRLLAFYVRRHPQGHAIQTAFPVAAVQRLGQALGAFVVLSAKPGMAHFRRHIPVAAVQMLRALTTLAMPELAAVSEELTAYVP